MNVYSFTPIQHMIDYVHFIITTIIAHQDIIYMRKSSFSQMNPAEITQQQVVGLQGQFAAS